jgi:ABC-type antimicrobial peptide transport system permease subunit
MFSRVATAGPTDFSGSSAPSVGIQYIHEDFFSTFGIDVLRGRVFDRSVDATVQPAVVLSERAASELFPDSDPIGQIVTLTREVFARGRSGTVIGVVNDVLYDRPEQGITADAYVSLRQGGMGSTVALRTIGEPIEVLDEARAVLNSLDREVPISQVRTIEDLQSASVADTRLLARLLTVFGGITVILAAAGVWGVVANRVAHQRREFGLRMALGAGSSSVIGLVLRQGLLLAAAGVTLGLSAVWVLSRALGSLLFDVSPLDPLILAGAAVILTCITVVAAYIPAHRATTIDPMEVLKTD